MDDSQKQQLLKPQQPSQPVSQDTTSLQQPPQPPSQQPVAPVSTPSKEQQPAEQVSEYVKPSHPELDLHPELQEAGVEKPQQNEQPQLTVEDKRAGIEPAKESTPVATQPTGAVTLPMTEQKAAEVVKTTKDTKQSLLWRAVLILKQFKKIHRKLLGDKP